MDWNLYLEFLKNNPYLYDIAIGLVIFIFALIKAKKGISKCLMPILMIVLSLSIGISASDILHPYVSDYVWDKAGDSIAEKFDEKVENVIDGVEAPIQSIHDLWNDTIEAINIFDLDLGTSDNTKVDLSNSNTVKELRELTMMEARALIDKLTKIALTIACVLAVFILLLIIRFIFGSVKEWGLISGIDKTLGFIFGLLEGYLLLLLIIRLSGAFGWNFFIDNADGTVLLKYFVGNV